MLNLNRYMRLTELFRHGFSFELFNCAFNIYNGGQVRGLLSLGNVHSSGTGHVPFTLFDLSFITGSMWAAQLTVLGMVIGTRMKPNVKIDPDTGQAEMIGPDYRTVYVNLSMLNQPLNEKEII